MLLPTFILSAIALSSATSLQAPAARDFIPDTSSSDPVNASIAAYNDAVLQAIAQSPPTSESYAMAKFTNGVRGKALNDAGSYFNFTELAGTSGLANLTTMVIKFEFPGGLSSTNNIFGKLLVTFLSVS